MDNNVVWSGSVGHEALAFDGPIGIRTGNIRLPIELRAACPLEAPSKHFPGCRFAMEENE